MTPAGWPFFRKPPYRIELHGSRNRLHGGSWDFENKYSSQVVVHCCSAIEVRLLLL